MYTDDIKEQFRKVIEFSQKIPNPQLDELFENWLEAKRDIIEAFGGKLIYEIPTTIAFHLDEKEQKKHFDNFVNEIYYTYHNSELVNFLNANFEGFYNNTVPLEYEKDNIKVPKGMKLVKAFKYFEKDKNLLTQFQNRASQIIQEDKVEGTLCFSVHPLDYLSSSVNTYNWRSCHALDGEFRAGNLSYMVDKSTIICYLKGADNVELPMFPSEVPWNSKKWRVLLYLSQNWDMIFAGRQYPFSSKSGLDVVLTHLLQALKLPSDRYSKWSNNYINQRTHLKDGSYLAVQSNYIPIRNELYDIYNVVKDGENALQFNDLLRSTCYDEPYYSIKDEDRWWLFDMDDEVKKTSFIIGRAVKCLHCGENVLSSSDLMICQNCIHNYPELLGDEYVCDCCGASIASDEDYIEVDGEIVCEHCFETECFICDKCGTAHFNSFRRYDRKYDAVVCIDCYEASNTKEV